MGFTKDLIGWTDQISVRPDDLQLTRLLFKDWLGCVSAGLADQQNRQNLKALGLLPNNREMFRLTVPEVAFALGMTSHCLELDDSEFFSETHPSAVIFSTLLAVSDFNRPLIDIFQAAIRGFYSLVPIGQKFNPRHYSSGWHGTGTLAPFAATLACANLNNFTKEQTESALGHVGTMVSGMHHSFGFYSKYLNSGAAARNAVIATLLSRAGERGVSDVFERNKGAFEMLSAEDPAADAFPRELSLEFIKTKRHPLCHCILPIIESFQDLIDKNQIVQDEIERVQVYVSDYSRNILKFDDPISKSEAFFSIPYALAAISLKPHLSCSDFFSFLDSSDWKKSFATELVADSQLEFMNHKITIDLKSKKKISGEFCFDRGFGVQRRDFLDKKFMDITGHLIRDHGALDILLDVVKGKEGATVGDFYQLARQCFQENFWLR